MEANTVQKSYFDVLGICCPSEIPLIDNILKPLEGIIEVNVVVPSRTVIVIHDNHIISQIQIVKALNSARLEANVRVYGQQNSGKKWPSPYTIGCGLLVAISTFKFVFLPLQWVGLAAVALGILPILLRSIASVRNLALDVNILVLIAVGGAISLGDYWEAGTVVFLFTIAEWLESRASHKANAVMSSLMSMAPQKAVLAETGQVIEAKDVVLDTVLAIKAGEVIPIDGVVVEGNCEVDEKTLTGESLPVLKQIESTVWAGTINLNGYISVRTTALAEDCVVAKMAKLVEEAQNSKSGTQRMVDQFAKFYTPLVMLASLSLIVVPAALRKHDIRKWAHLALVVLVSACPCALILSTPVATFCAFTKAATSGILIKGGDYLEVLGKAKIVGFDKTGTITRGEFSVTDFRSIDLDISLNTLLYWVSSIESKASHPMAAALVDYCHLNSIDSKPENVTDFQNFPGEGIHGLIDERSIYIGNKRIAVRAGCNTIPSHGYGSEERETIGYIFAEETLVGVFSMADTCRTGILAAMTQLKSLGIKTAMLTGDSLVAAMRVQDQLGHILDEVHAELLPEEKVRIIKNLKKEGPTVMIGDGVNDAPALATADIGISMGISGSALATETGHITLMSNDMRKIPEAIGLARRTLWKIRQNLVLSFITKAAVLALAICGHPILWAAVLVDVGTCLLVIFNSMLILQGTTDHHRGKHHGHTHEHNSAGHGSHNGCHLPHDNHGCGSKSANNLHSHSNHVHEEKCSHSVQKCTPVSTSHTVGLHNGHGSHNGCQHLPHDKHGCGSKSIHSPSRHSDHVHEENCSHDDLPNVCGHKEDQKRTPEMASHVVEISKIESENHSHDEHTVCAKHDSTTGSTEVCCALDNQQSGSKLSHHKRKAFQGHSTSLANETNQLVLKVKQACEEHIHSNHSHDLNLKQHHHHHHLSLPLNEGIKATSTIYGGCLHNRGRYVNCQTCIPDTSITIS